MACANRTHDASLFHAVRPRTHTGAIDSWCPTLRVAERDGRVQLALEGFSSFEGDTLQDAADELVVRLLQFAMAVRAGTLGPLVSELRPDPALLGFLWKLGELAAAGGEPRELLFGPNLLAA